MQNVSHPVWVRGLKPFTALNMVKLRSSHPVWVRGLKHQQQDWSAQMADVAPRVGAWIETLKGLLSHHDGRSHPVWVRGLKPAECGK